MTAPGGFSSGDVLTAADMNALPAGSLAQAETSADFTLTSSFSDVLDLTFTISSTRQIMCAVSIPLIDNPTGSPTLVVLRLQNTNAAGSPTQYFATAYAPMTATNGAVTFYNVNNLTAGTYTIYLVASTNTGTARLSGNASDDRRHQFTIIDLGDA